MRKNLKLAWLLGGALLVPACTTEDSTTTNDMPTVLRASAGGGEGETLRGVEVDPDTYGEIVRAVGEAPSGLGMVDAPAGTIRILLSPASPLVAVYSGPPVSMPPLTITLDDGSPEPIALLVPAVQKVREAAARSGSAQPAGTIALTLEGSMSIGRAPAPGPSDLDDRVATIMVHGMLAPGATAEQRYALGTAFDQPIEGGDLTLNGGGAGFTLGALDLNAPYLMGRWSPTGAAMNLVVDVRMDGVVLTRFRIPRATPDAVRGQAAAAPRGHVKVFDGMTGISRDGNAERAMFDVNYATFSADAIDTARRSIVLNFGNATMQEAVSGWGANRTQVVAELIAASGAGGAPAYEALACVAALPAAVSIAKTLDPRAEASASAMATVEEAATEVHATARLTVGGELALERFGAPAPSGDAELACAAVRELAALPDTAGTTEGYAIRVLSAELATFDARQLDVMIADWIDAMDAFVAAPTTSGWAGSGAKADILIEALGAAAERSAARWEIAASLLGE